MTSIDQSRCPICTKKIAYGEQSKYDRATLICPVCRDRETHNPYTQKELLEWMRQHYIQKIPITEFLKKYYMVLDAYPTQYNGKLIHPYQSMGTIRGDPVTISPYDPSYQNKTYHGIYLGLAEIKDGHIPSPAIYIPETNTIVLGISSVWNDDSIVDVSEEEFEDAMNRLVSELKKK